MKRDCKIQQNEVKSNTDGKVSSLFGLQPGKRKSTFWTDFMADWHLDKRVPVTLITAILFQTMAGIWWASNVDAHVVEHEKKLTNLTEYIIRQNENDTRIREALARLDERVELQTRLLADIEKKTR